MSTAKYSKIITYTAPGELRAALLDKNGRAWFLFLERWGGVRSLARFGSVYSARVRSFSNEVKGAFVELATGEEALLRLGQNHGLNEGQEVTVEIRSEARLGKLARVRLSKETPCRFSAFESWRNQTCGGDELPIEEDWNGVDAAFDDALAGSVTLPRGGQLHIERTRALTAFDVDSSGRQGRGSAGAKALSLNREAVAEMVRQIGLRRLGGAFVLDCVEPLNRNAREALKATAEEAFDTNGFTEARIIAPSSIGLLQAALPWTFCPVEDVVKRNPAETEFLSLLRQVQRDATSEPAALFELALSKSLWQAYLDRKSDADSALQQSFGGRVTLLQGAREQTKVTKR